MAPRNSSIFEVILDHPLCVRIQCRVQQQYDTAVCTHFQGEKGCEILSGRRLRDINKQAQNRSGIPEAIRRVQYGVAARRRDGGQICQQRCYRDLRVDMAVKGRSCEVLL